VIIVDFAFLISETRRHKLRLRSSNSKSILTFDGMVNCIKEIGAGFKDKRTGKTSSMRCRI
jgi:hypothetical protein